MFKAGRILNVFLQEAFPVLSVVKNIDKEFRAVIGGSNSTAYWSILNYINQKINQIGLFTVVCNNCNFHKPRTID